MNTEVGRVMERLTCMEAFVRVADAGGFSEAARRWGKSKGVVSKYVAQLEESLGVQLVQRSTRGISLTAAGDAHYERCRHILGLIDDAETAAREAAQHVGGPLRVSAPHGFFSEGRASVISQFLDRFPNVTLTLAPSDRLVELTEERVDVAIRVTDPQDSSLIARKIASMRFALVAAPSYLAAHGEPESPEALRNHSCLTDGSFGDPPRWAFQFGEERVEVAPHVRVATGSPFVARDLAIEGHGLALCPTLVVGDALARGALVELWPGHAAAAWGVYAVTSQRRHLPARARAFMSHLADVLPAALAEAGSSPAK